MIHSTFLLTHGRLRYRSMKTRFSQKKMLFVKYIPITIHVTLKNGHLVDTLCVTSQCTWYAYKSIHQSLASTKIHFQVQEQSSLKYNHQISSDLTFPQISSTFEGKNTTKTIKFSSLWAKQFSIPPKSITHKHKHSKHRTTTGIIKH